MACADESAAWPLSSPIVADLAECDPIEAAPAVMDLVDRFGQIADPRQARWVEHPLPAVLALCAGAVVAGNSSFTAIAGWVAEVPIDLRVTVYSPLRTQRHATVGAVEIHDLAAGDKDRSLRG